MMLRMRPNFRSCCSGIFSLTYDTYNTVFMDGVGVTAIEEKHVVSQSCFDPLHTGRAHIQRIQ